MKNILLEIIGTAIIGAISYSIFVLPFNIAIVKSIRNKTKQPAYITEMILASCFTLLISLIITGYISTKVFPSTTQGINVGTIIWFSIAIIGNTIVMLSNDTN